MSFHDSLTNHSLHSSLSNPNLQSSLSGPAFSGSLSSASLQSSLSNPSLQSSLGSSPSLHSSLGSSPSLHSSLSSSSLQSAPGANPGCSGGNPSPASSYQPALSTSPRRRTQLSPLILPMGGDSRRPQFSPTISPTLSSITQVRAFPLTEVRGHVCRESDPHAALQGVALDTSKLPVDQRLPPYPLSQQQRRPGVQQHQQHQQNLQNLRNTYNQQLQHFGLVGAAVCACVRERACVTLSLPSRGRPPPPPARV